MPTISEVAARATFAALVNRVAYGRERVMVTRRGQEVVALIPAEDVALLELLEGGFDLGAAKAALADRAIGTALDRPSERGGSGLD